MMNVGILYVARQTNLRLQPKSTEAEPVFTISFSFDLLNVQKIYFEKLLFCHFLVENKSGSWLSEFKMRVCI